MALVHLVERHLQGHDGLEVRPRLGGGALLPEFTSPAQLSCPMILFRLRRYIGSIRPLQITPVLIELARCWAWGNGAALFALARNSQLNLSSGALKRLFRVNTSCGRRCAASNALLKPVECIQTPPAGMYWLRPVYREGGKTVIPAPTAA